MEREIIEVLQSQQKMLIRNGKAVKEDRHSISLIKSYEKTISEVKTWAENQANVDILYVPHRAVMEAPFYQAMLINDFLGGKLIPEKMASVVDPSLYREKIG